MELIWEVTDKRIKQVDLDKEENYGWITLLIRI
jgi:hypothetical protein